MSYNQENWGQRKEYFQTGSTSKSAVHGFPSFYILCLGAHSHSLDIFLYKRPRSDLKETVLTSSKSCSWIPCSIHACTITQLTTWRGAIPYSHFLLPGARLQWPFCTRILIHWRSCFWETNSQEWNAWLKRHIYILTLMHIARLLSTMVVTLYIPTPPAPLSLKGNLGSSRRNPLWTD